MLVVVTGAFRDNMHLPLRSKTLLELEGNSLSCLSTKVRTVISHNEDNSVWSNVSFVLQLVISDSRGQQVSAAQQLCSY